MKRNKDSESGKTWRKSTILMLLGVLCLSVMFLGSGYQERQRMEDLLIQRYGIIQLVWYSSITPRQGETMLSEIEVHPLLGEDVAWLRAAEEGMGFSYVMDMELLKLRQTSVSARGICYIAEIQWELEEYNQHISEIQTYRIRAVKEPDGTVKVAEFEPI